MHLLLAATLAVCLASLANGQAQQKPHGTTCVWSESPFWCGETKFEGNFWLYEIDANKMNDELGRGQIWYGLIQAGNKKTGTWCFVNPSDKDGKGNPANYIEPRLNIHHSCCKDSKTHKPYSSWYRHGLKDIQIDKNGALPIKGVDLSKHCSIE